MTKGQLKIIVKECLTEILFENFKNSLTENFKNSLSSTTVQNVKLQEHRNNIPFNGIKNTTKKISPLDIKVGSEPKIMQQTKQAINNLGVDNTMRKIFEDTAVNTLPKMQSLGSEKSEKGNTTALMEHIGDLNQTFGQEVVSNWAELAFATSKKIN